MIAICEVGSVSCNRLFHSMLFRSNERESPAIEQAVRASLVGGSGDVSCTLGGTHCQEFGLIGQYLLWMLSENVEYGLCAAHFI